MAGDLSHQYGRREDPHWIYPDEILKLPGDAVKGDSTPVTTVVDDRMSPMGPTLLVEAPRSRLNGVLALRVPPRRHGLALRRFRHGVSASRRTRGRDVCGSLGRPLNGPNDQGTWSAARNLGIACHAAHRMLNEERAYITLPKGMVTARGDNYLAFALGPVLENGSQMVEPTGVVEVERAENGDASTVRIITQYGNVEAGQGVIPIDHFTLGNDARPAPLMLGPEARWCSSGRRGAAFRAELCRPRRDGEGRREGRRSVHVLRAASQVLVMGRGDQKATSRRSGSRSDRW